MDFYLDTGVIYGRIDHNDPFNPICIDFFRIHPFNGNNFHTTKYIVEKELENVRFKRTLGLPKVGREIERRARLLLKQIKNVEFSAHPSYKLIFTELETMLLSYSKKKKPKEHDAKLLSNAYIWDATSPLIDPHFITIDDEDIAQNKVEIQKIAEKHLLYKAKIIIALINTLI